MVDLRDFLEAIELSELLDLFASEDLGLHDLADLSSEDFRELGVKLGHRKRIQRELSARGMAPAGASSFASGRSGGGVSDQETAVAGWGSSAPSTPSSLGPGGAGSTAPELQAGDVLGPFELVRPLGEGSFGRVWQAHDRDLGHDVALKMVQTAGPAELAARSLSQEFAVRGRIGNSTHVLRAERPRVEKLRGSELLVMPLELADGDSLRAWMLEHRHGPTEDWLEAALDLFDQACRGVEAIHAAGLVHLDLKPENLLLAGGTLKVADFGLSRDLGRLSSVASQLLGDGVGTPTYMAPEQVMAMRPEDVGPAADIWSLGVILFELLDGHPPVGGRSAEDVRRKICNASLPIRYSKVPPSFVALLKSCLQRDETKRIASATAIREKLAWICEGGPEQEEAERQALAEQEAEAERQAREVAAAEQARQEEQQQEAEEQLEALQELVEGARSTAKEAELELERVRAETRRAEAERKAEEERRDTARREAEAERKAEAKREAKAAREAEAERKAEAKREAEAERAAKALAARGEPPAKRSWWQKLVSSFTGEEEGEAGGGEETSWQASWPQRSAELEAMSHRLDRASADRKASAKEMKRKWKAEDEAAAKRKAERERKAEADRKLRAADRAKREQERERKRKAEDEAAAKRKAERERKAEADRKARAAEAAKREADRKARAAEAAKREKRERRAAADDQKAMKRLLGNDPAARRLEGCTVKELRSLLREHGDWGYSKLRRNELIERCLRMGLDPGSGGGGGSVTQVVQQSDGSTVYSSGGGRITVSGGGGQITVSSSGGGGIVSQSIEIGGSGGSSSSSAARKAPRKASASMGAVEARVRSSSLGQAKRSGVNSQLSGVYDAVKISGVNHQLSVVVLDSLKISGVNCSGVVYLAPGATVKVSGVDDSSRKQHCSWEELDDIIASGRVR